MNEPIKLPTTFWIIAIVGLLWNLLGVMAWVGQIMMTPEAMAALPDAERALYESSPSWLTIVYGIAVIGGTLGCVGLLMKKGWAEILFLISLIAIIIQMGYSTFLTDAMDVFGATALIMPLVVIVIAAFLWYYSKQCKAKGWIS